MELKNVLADASISRTFEFDKSDVSLLKVFNWNAFKASYVALFNFASYDTCNPNVFT